MDRQRRVTPPAAIRRVRGRRRNRPDGCRSGSGEALDVPASGVVICGTLHEVLTGGARPDVLIDYTDPASVKRRTFEALQAGIRMVIGTSGLAADDFLDIEQQALACGLGVIAAGNFSITAALAKHCSLLAARYLPTWEIIDYASAPKVDALSGTTRELAESMGDVAVSELAVSLDDTHGERRHVAPPSVGRRSIPFACPASSSPSRRSSASPTSV